MLLTIGLATFVNGSNNTLKTPKKWHRKTDGHTDLETESTQWANLVETGEKRVNMGQIGSILVQTGPNGSKQVKGSIRLKSGQKGSTGVKTGQNKVKTALKKGQDVTTVVKMGQNGSK